MPIFHKCVTNISMTLSKELGVLKGRYFQEGYGIEYLEVIGRTKKNILNNI